MNTEKIAALNIMRMALADVNHPHPQNPRDMPAEGSEELQKLDASLEDRYFEPIIWNKRNGMLISGHVRVPRMIHLGYTHADVQVEDIDEESHLAMMTAANAHAGRTNEEKLGKLLASIKSGAPEKLKLAMMKIKEQNKLMRRVADKAPVKLVLEKEHEETGAANKEEEASPPKPAALPARYIIGFPVNLIEKQQWDAVKAALAIADDKNAFIELITRFKP